MIMLSIAGGPSPRSAPSICRLFTTLVYRSPVPPNPLLTDLTAMSRPRTSSVPEEPALFLSKGISNGGCSAHPSKLISSRRQRHAVGGCFTSARNEVTRWTACVGHSVRNSWRFYACIIKSRTLVGAASDNSPRGEERIGQRWLTETRVLKGALIPSPASRCHWQLRHNSPFKQRNSYGDRGRGTLRWRHVLSIFLVKLTLITCARRND